VSTSNRRTPPPAVTKFSAEPDEIVPFVASEAPVIPPARVGSLSAVVPLRSPGNEAVVRTEDNPVPTPAVEVSPPVEVPPAVETPALNEDASVPTNQTAPSQKTLCILLPQYKHTNPLTLTSIAALRDQKTMSVVVHFGDAFIVHTRNRLADTFMKDTECEWALFVDDDMVLPIGNVSWYRKMTGFGFVPDRLAGLNAIDRLLSHRKTVVGGLYFGRNQLAAKRAIFAEGGTPGPYANKFGQWPIDKVIQTKWVGTGCLLVHRSVFTAIQKKFPHLAPKKAGEPWNYFSAAPDALIDVAAQYIAGVQTKEQLTAALRTAQSQSYAMGEDVLFCQRALAAGHQPHVDLGLLCGHVGSYVYGPR